jgi:hypothetical protein
LFICGILSSLLYVAMNAFVAMQRRRASTKVVTSCLVLLDRLRWPPEGEGL